MFSECAHAHQSQIQVTQGMEEREGSIARLQKQRGSTPFSNKVLEARLATVCDAPEGGDPADKTC